MLRKKCMTKLTLKPPSRLDKLIESIPKPKEATVDFGLPKWKSIPLDAKIPIYPSPHNAYDFARQKLGQKLHSSFPEEKFNLSDPYNRELNSTYNALHDKHLAHFFSRPNNKKHLIKMGLVNNQSKVKCSPKEYNDQRAFWRKVYSKMVQNELKKKDELYQERKMLQEAENMARKEEKKLQEPDRTKRAEEIRKLNAENRLKFILNKEKRRENYFNKFILVKRDEYSERVNKSVAKMIHVQRTLNLAKRLEKCRLLTILRARRIKDRKRIREKEMREAYEKNRKITEINNRWEQKEAEQKKCLENQRILLTCAQEERKRNIEKYNEKINRIRELDQQLFKTIKNKKNVQNKATNKKAYNSQNQSKINKSQKMKEKVIHEQQEQLKQKKNQFVLINRKQNRK